MLSHLYKENRGKAYYVNKEFAQALSSIDKGIPIQLIPTPFSFYLQLPERLYTVNEFNVEGMLVSIGSAEYLDIEGPDIARDAICIGITSVIYNYSEHLPGECSPVAHLTINSPIKSGQTIADMLLQLENRIHTLTDLPIGGKSSDIYKQHLPLVLTALNTAVYIHSADPDIQKLAPLCEYSHKKRAQIKKGQPIPNELTVPVTLLNWNFHSKQVYSVDETIVSSHLRWQPCGPHRSQVKLILVEEHIRHYRKETQNEVPATDSETESPCHSLGNTTPPHGSDHLGVCHHQHTTDEILTESREA